MFPYDFGFFPQTRSEDGDPLDVLILSDEPTFPGCQIDCRLIGEIKAQQTEQGKLSRNGVGTESKFTIVSTPNHPYSAFCFPPILA